tara:strand:+ start:331 stop:741 length:411 start_codon:yes stop_codon:yes gene_type:complete
MTKDRLDWLKRNRPPMVIFSNNNQVKGDEFNVKESSVNYNNDSFNLHHLTKKGYNSKKPLFIDFLTVDRIEVFEVKKQGKPFDRRVIILTNEEFEYLRENFSKIGNIFQTAEQKARVAKAAGMRALAERIDIHDRG